MTRRDVTIHLMSTAASPITQMARTAGNEALIFRQSVDVPGEGRREVPAISGNALRSALLRSPGADFLCDRWGLAGGANKRCLNFLFHGGTVNESTARQDPRRTAEFYRLLPLGRVLGGCLPDDFIPGHAKVDVAVLACRENAGRMATFSPAFDGVADLFGPHLRPAESFVGQWSYYRRGVDGTRPELAGAAPAAAGVTADPEQRGVFAGECVTPGATFLHRVHLVRASDLDVGAVLLSLSAWADGGGFVGGMSARGHGSLSTAVYCPPDTDVAGLMAGYAAHVDAVRDEGRAWLASAFEPPPAKPKKPVGGKGKGVKADGPATSDG